MALAIRWFGQFAGFRYLEEFISIVEDADIRAVTNMIATFQSPGQLGNYEIVETLVVYYQMVTPPFRAFSPISTVSSTV